MSRESRLAKRDSKLKKLAAKRGVAQLPPQSRSTGDVTHMARVMFLAQSMRKLEAANAAELKRALDKVIPTTPQLTGTMPEQRVQFEALIKDVATEAKLLDIEGRRIDIDELTVVLTEHLAWVEHGRRATLRQASKPFPFEVTP